MLQSAGINDRAIPRIPIVAGAFPATVTALHVPETLRPANASVAATLRVSVIAAAVVLTIWLLSSLVLLVFMAVLLAVILRGASDWIAARTGIRRNLMLAAVSLCCAVLVLGFLDYVGPRLMAQSQDLWQRLQQTIGWLRQHYGDTPFGRMAFTHFASSQQLSSDVSRYARVLATTTLGSVATGFILIVTALYFAISPRLYVGGLVRLFPLPYRPHAARVFRAIGRTLRWWVLGQFVDMVAVGVLTGIGLTLIGIPLALALAVLAGVLTFVPYFGAIAAAVPAAVVALTVSWHAALWVVVLFLGAHSIEGYLISPLVQRRTVALPPAVSILSMTLFGTLFGPLGVILGTPIAAALLITVREAYVGAVLGDPDVAGPEDAGA